MAKGKNRNSSSKNRRDRHFARAIDKKNKRVQKSSHGRFKSVEELENHRKKVSGTEMSKTFMRKKRNKQLASD